MRLIHTSDWHLGRNLKGKDRTPEIEYALKELFKKATELEVDAILVAGDLFETANPTSEAERVAYQFFSDLQSAKIPAIVIAGNHDSANRFNGFAKILSLAGVKVIGRPRLLKDGGLISLETASGKLSVASMPFASERKLLTYENFWEKSDLEQVQNYRNTIEMLLKNLAQGFKDDSVNIVMAHMTIDGAKLTNSERPYQTRGNYALSEQSLPAEAQYIALGHVHKSQKISSTAPTYYCGSLIQVDFGEAGDEKGFYLIDVESGRPANTPEFISIPCQKPLEVIECNLSNYEDILNDYRSHSGYLKVIMNLDSPQSWLADNIRKICGDKVLDIQAIYPEIKTKQEREFNQEDFDPVEEFKRFLQEQGKNPTRDILKEFENLYNEIKDN
jgi:exonuclease SbcD